MVSHEQMDTLTERLNEIESERFKQMGYTHTPDVVHWKDRGKKFVAVDIGGRGAWLIEKTTGEIFNIKGYGVADYNKKRKANIGNIDTVDPVNMHNRRWNYLR